MQKQKTNKGITIIALVITIILMLILAGVTLTVALDGTLFNKAEQTADETQIAADRQILLSEITTVMTNRGKVDIERLKNYLPDWTIEEKSSPYKCISPNGNIFILTEKGEILEQ